MIILPREAENNPCVGCLRGCCSKLLVGLCGYDVWRISNALHIRPTVFVAFARRDETSRDDFGPYDFGLDRSASTYHMVLNVREGTDSTHPCIFALDLPTHEVRCGVYSSRPISCQSYPLTFAGEEIIVKPSLCPDGAWDLSKVNLSYWREELGRHNMEWSIHSFVVESWNKKVMKEAQLQKLDFRPFLDFLLDVYQRLELARAEVPTEAWSGIWEQWRWFTAKQVNPLLLQESESIAAKSWHRWLKYIRKAVAGH